MSLVFLVNYFKDCGVGMWLCGLAGCDCRREVLSEQVLTISRRMDLESFLAPTPSAFLAAHRQIRGGSTAHICWSFVRPPNVGP